MVKFKLDPSESKYEIYRGKPIRIEVSGKSISGIVEDVKGNVIYLKPSMIPQNLQADTPSKWEYHVILEKELPTMVELIPPYVIYPLEKGYLEKLVKGYNKWNKSKKKPSKKEEPKEPKPNS